MTNGGDDVWLPELGHGGLLLPPGSLGWLPRKEARGYVVGMVRQPCREKVRPLARSQCQLASHINEPPWILQL